GTGPRRQADGAVARRAPRPRRLAHGGDRAPPPALRRVARPAAAGLRRGRPVRRRVRHPGLAAPVRRAVRADAGGAERHHDGDVGGGDQAAGPAGGRWSREPLGLRRRRPLAAHPPHAGGPRARRPAGRRARRQRAPAALGPHRGRAQPARVVAGEVGQERPGGL
ncbi:MAG: Transcriptional regulator, MarR family, partial [uncultured Nocardioides sp.]